MKVDGMKVHFSGLNGRYAEVGPEYVTHWQDNDHEAGS